MRNACASLLLLALCTSAAARTQAQDPTIRIAGDAAMTSLVEAWEQQFAATHPGVQFENQLLGTDMGMGMLYGGKADIALLGRESNQVEDDSFLHSLQYTPVSVRLTTGSLDVPEKTYAPVVFVARDNPLQHITLADLDRVFGCGQTGGCGQAGVPMPARTWGELGLTGRWKSAPIHVYTFDTRSGTGLFLVSRLQGASKKMNWEVIREFHDVTRPDGTMYEAGQQTIDALVKDRFGLAASGLHYATGAVKPLALAAAPGGPFMLPTPESLVDQSYPLARLTYAFLNRPPGRPLPALAAEFLRFALSEEGQGMIATHGFLPLAKADAARQAATLH